MQIPKNSNQFGVHETAAGLHRSLQQYIEAQYHIKDDALVSERKELLQQPGVIAQLAYVEATPIYALGHSYQELDIPMAAKNALTSIALLGGQVGLYPRPYQHQAQALEEFLGKDPSDIVVATGTGSGKTESFLMPIIGELAIESAERPGCNDLPGCRAILLYPMNALVNDQLARIRRLLGDCDVNAILSKGRSRPIRFGSYTGRTPYPGKRTAGKDSVQIAPLFEEFYLKVELNPELQKKLRLMGRWPSKDMAGFYNSAASETKEYKSGKKVGKSYVAGNWTYRLKTLPSDRELLTRHEMQKECPDVLITNYSMLEYMLLRPIERSIFEQTAQWLAADDRNELVLVLDEAHMYRGAGGAEVALLLRRLIARLGITRERVRCILTSASLGEGESAIKEVIQFAKDLTGHPIELRRTFKVVTGTKEQRALGCPGSDTEASELAECDVNDLANFNLEPDRAIAVIKKLASALSWSWTLQEEADFQDELFKTLTGFGPVELLISQVMGKATALRDLQKTLFPSSSEKIAKSALDALLVMCSIAKRASDGRVLMPTRLHLFHRGLPGLYACIDPLCTSRLYSHKEPSLVGKFHTKSLVACGCNSQARVFEFYTHRDCGAAFVRGWVDDSLNFLWHEPDLISTDDKKRQLYPVDILVEREASASAQTRKLWLHIPTGRLVSNIPESLQNFRVIHIPDKNVLVTKELLFDNCPICMKRTRQSTRELSKIMDHVTKGEAPFSTLVRAQMNHQPTTKKADKSFPNAGRKVLVFSDGRQKAARLARDMPRDMELDVYRQAIAAAVAALKNLGKEARPTDTVLYLAFLSVLSENNLSMFDVDALTVDGHVENFEKNGSDLNDALIENYPPGTPPFRYKVALLKLLCSSYYSLSGTTVGFVEPTKISLKKLAANLGTSIPAEDLRTLTVAWVDEMLSSFAFDPDVRPHVREKAAGFYKDKWGAKGTFAKQFRDALLTKFGFASESVEQFEKECRSLLAALDKDDELHLLPNALKLNIDLEQHWFLCGECTSLMPMAFRGKCMGCGGSQIRELDPATDPYLVARKSFWRGPVSTALLGQEYLTNLYAEEHTAQLSNRDRKSVHSTTELHELRFQDLLLNEKDRPIDVLSCTTTMEVGIDIGSLVAVALRNVPPQRENYQQRAGRAGRRGSSVSSVVTYSQNGPHDSYYFLNPQAMVSGPPRNPELKVDNPKIANRHICAYLIQTYFHTHLSANLSGSGTAILNKSLGGTREFFHSEVTGGLNLQSFTEWVRTNVINEDGGLRGRIAAWLPTNLDVPDTLEKWVAFGATSFLDKLHALKPKVPKLIASGENVLDQGEDDEDDESTEVAFEKEDLLEFLFFHSLLPTYAFPTSLCSFLVEKFASTTKGYTEIRVEQMPQQSTNQALSEYAPGRLVVINKQTYRSGGVFANAVSTEVDRAERLFQESKRLVICNTCSFVKDPYSNVPLSCCPVCGDELRSECVIQPEVFGPEAARSLPEEDREQDITYATMAQFPQPVGGESFEFSEAGPHLKFAHATDSRLLTMNKGKNRKGEALGFSVCRKCGCSVVNDDETVKTGKHKRPYLVKGFNIPQCDGEFERVFLWFDFSTDLLLLRLKISPPLLTDLESSLTVKTIESAAHSLAEALRLAASRHRQLDLDPTEFGAGHRLLPATQDGSVLVDIYLYDTLAGGAGYSQLAAKYFNEIVNETLDVLESCDCETSCTECLDHFHNQHIKQLLDRKLGASLLRYCLYGSVPAPASVSGQVVQLTALMASLALDQYSCEMGVEINGLQVPLVVRNGNKVISVKTYPPLLDVGLVGQDEVSTVFYCSEIDLRKDLPGMHAKIRKLLN